MFQELTAEKEEELINKLARKIVDLGLETPAIFFLEWHKPIATISAQTVLFPAAPFLEAFGVAGYDWAQLFMKKENVEKLLKKIEELSNEAKTVKREEKPSKKRRLFKLLHWLKQ